MLASALSPEHLISTFGLIGLFVIVFTVVITGIYVSRANREYDELSDAIRAKVGA